jgi:hypothetical protein
MINVKTGLVITNHLLWFRHFQRPPHSRTGGSSSYPGYGYGTSTDPNHYRYNPYDPATAGSLPSFNEIASYFGLCVWLVPFSLFIALSAGENVLPSMGSEYATGEGSSFVAPGQEPGKKGTAPEGMAKAVVNGVRDAVRGAGEVVGWWKPEGRRRFD